MTKTLGLKLRWQWIPTVIFITVMATWLVLEGTGVLSLEGFLQDLNQQEWLISALIIVLLLTADLFIPIPSTLLMPLAGHMFGILWGVVLVTIGSMLLSIIGYAIGKTGGKSLVDKVVSPEETEKMEQWMTLYGKWPVLLSKTFPMIAETVSFTAGISRMRFTSYLLLSFAGTLPVCFLYVWAGEKAESIEEIFIIAIGGFLIALLLFFAIRHFYREKHSGK